MLVALGARIDGRRTAWQADASTRRRILHRDHDDGARRRRDSRGDRVVPAAGAGRGIGVREVRASGLALRRGRRGGAGASWRNGTCSGVQRRAGRPGAARAARCRRSSRRWSASRRTRRRSRPLPRARATTSGIESTATSSRRPSIARRWRRSTSSARSRQRSRAPSASGRDDARPAGPAVARPARSTSCSRRWRRSATWPNAGWPSRSTWRLRLQRPLFLEGEAGVGKTEVAKVLAAALDTELIRLQCYEGLDISHAVLRVELSAPAARDPPARRGPRARSDSRDPRAVHRAVPDQAAAAPGARVGRQPAAGSAHRRDRSRRRGVRGLPAGVPVGLSGHDPRARHDSRQRRRRSS